MNKFFKYFWHPVRFFWAFPIFIYFVTLGFLFYDFFVLGNISDFGQVMFRAAWYLVMMLNTAGILSILYLLIAAYLRWVKKDKRAKIFFVTGIIGLAVYFTLYYLLSIIFAIFGLAAPGGQLPTI